MHELIASQITDAYNKLVNKQEVESQKLNINTMSQVIEKERQVLNKDFKLQASKFWLSFINDVPTSVELPSKSDLLPKHTFSGNKERPGEFLYFSLNKEQTEGVKRYARENKTTLFITLAAFYGVVVAKYCNQDNFFLTYSLNLRPLGFSKASGCFINNLPLKFEIENTDSFTGLIHKLTNDRRISKEFQAYSLTDIISDQRKYNNATSDSYFNVGFTQSNLNAEALNLHGIHSEVVDIAWSVNVINDFGLMYDDRKLDEIKFKLEYNKALLSKEFANKFIQSFLTLLTTVTNKNTKFIDKISDYCVLNQVDYKKVIYDWNSLDKAYSDDNTLHGIFELVAKDNPSGTAVTYLDNKYSYSEINSRANELAHYLYSKCKVQVGDLIGLCLPRGEQLVVAILGMLKVGCAYVPLDPDYPVERVSYILEDTKTKVVLTSSKCSVIEGAIDVMISATDENAKQVLYSGTQTNKLGSKKLESDTNKLGSKKLESDTNKLDSNNKQAGTNTIKIINLDKDEIKSYLQVSQKGNLGIVVPKDSLAYVIYTSGTTGKPKGVLQEHRNVVRLLSATDEKYHFNSKDVWTLFHSYVFDFSVWELWGALCYGGTLVVPSHEVTRDSNLFYELCKREGVTVLNQTPTAFYQFIAVAVEKDCLSSLRYVIFGGEALNLEQLRPWFNHYGYTKPRLVNMYGITETTVHVTYKAIEESDIGKSSYIGRPIPDQKLYVLDKHLKPLPIGSIGELYVGGAGLARGYLNLPELTSKRFITNPFQSEKERELGINGRLYKTGDLVRYLSDGEIEYIGRNDFQVKIRGFRIELGEIENRISSYPGVKQSVVVVYETEAAGLVSNKSLVGYYVADRELDEVMLQEYLKSELAEYMVPTKLIYLEKFPLTINGKLDTRALPKPEFGSGNEYVAPKTKLEEDLCGLFAEVLGVAKEKVGINDDFFRMGGDSIIAIQLVSRLRKRLNLHLSVKDVFQDRTITRLIGSIESSQKNDGVIKNTLQESGILNGEFGILPIQEWFFSNIDAGYFTDFNHFNQAFMIRVGQLDQKLLVLSINKLIEYHDAFRLTFKKRDKKYLQVYTKVNEGSVFNSSDLKYLNISEIGYDEYKGRLTSWQNEFDINNGSSLYVFAYIDGYKDNSSRIFIAAHHLIIDAVSWRIITEDLKILYQNFTEASAKGRINELVSKPSELILGKNGTSYRQWVNLVNSYPNYFGKEESYWNNMLASLAGAELQLNNLNEKISISSEFELDKDLTQKLLTLANKAYHTTINDLLLSAFNLALSDLTQSNLNYINLEGHGRDTFINSIQEPGHYADIGRTVGWFTTMFPIKLTCDRNSLGQTIVQTKEQLNNVPNKGIGYGKICGYLENMALPKVTFNYLGQFDGTVDDWMISPEEVGITISSGNKDHIY